MNSPFAEKLAHMAPEQVLGGEVQEIIDSIKTKLAETIEALSAVNVPDHYHPINVRNSAQRDLNLFTNVIDRLPYEFELYVLTDRTSTEKVKRLRKKFVSSVRAEFFTKLIQQPSNVQALSNMSLSDDEIQAFSEGKVPQVGNSDAIYDVTIDHIKGIENGNGFRNLCIVPEHVNGLKGRFVSIQRAVDPDAPNRISFRPRHSVTIPFVTGGFRERIEYLDENIRSKTIETREREFLGLKY